MGQIVDLDPAAVDRDAPIPLYHQLRRALLEPLEQGHWKEGDLIPTEREICETYKVSRITVRRAINDLVREGYLLSHQGKGTFVARPKIQRQLTRLRSFSEEMEGLGLKAGSRLLSLRQEPALGDVAAALQVQEHDWIWIVERLRLVGDEPTIVSISHLRLPPEIVLTPAQLQGQASLWAILRRQGVIFARSESTIQGIAGSKRECELLEVGPGTPLLLVESIVYSDAGVPVEYTRMVSRGDRYKYAVHTRLLAGA
jgi:GntR family transcriptional regulator